MRTADEEEEEEEEGQEVSSHIPARFFSDRVFGGSSAPRRNGSPKIFA